MWQLNAVDAGVEEGAPPHVVEKRARIEEALAAANAGRPYVWCDEDTGLRSVKLIYRDGRPHLILIDDSSPLPLINTQAA